MISVVITETQVNKTDEATNSLQFSTIFINVTVLIFLYHHQ